MTIYEVHRVIESYDANICDNVKFEKIVEIFTTSEKAERYLKDLFDEQSLKKMKYAYSEIENNHTLDLTNLSYISEYDNDKESYYINEREID